MGENDDIEIVEEGDNDIDLEVLDDRPEEDRVPPRDTSAVGDEDFDADPSDLGEISKKVEKRLKRLKYEYHEERRAKEAAQRERDAAIAFAKQVREYADRTSKTLEDGEKLLLSEVKKKADLSIAAAKAKLQAALEEGDVAKAAEANSDLISAQIEQSQTQAYANRGQREFVNRGAVNGQQPTHPQPQPQPQPHRETEEWKSNNRWYGRDPILTSYAEAYATEFLNKTVNPVSDPVKYFSILDGEMKKRFPDKFNSSGESDSSSAARQRARGTAGNRSLSPYLSGSKS